MASHNGDESPSEETQGTIQGAGVTTAGAEAAAKAENEAVAQSETAAGAVTPEVSATELMDLGTAEAAEAAEATSVNVAVRGRRRTSGTRVIRPPKPKKTPRPTLTLCPDERNKSSQKRKIEDINSSCEIPKKRCKCSRKSEESIPTLIYNNFLQPGEFTYSSELLSNLMNDNNNSVSCVLILGNLKPRKLSGNGNEWRGEDKDEDKGDKDSSERGRDKDEKSDAGDSDAEPSSQMGNKRKKKNNRKKNCTFM